MKLKLLLFRKLLYKGSDFDSVLIFIGLCSVSHLQSVSNGQNNRERLREGCNSQDVLSLFGILKTKLRTAEMQNYSHLEIQY